MNHILNYHKYAEDNPRRIPNTIQQRIALDKKLLRKYKYQESYVDDMISWIEYYVCLNKKKANYSAKKNEPEHLKYEKIKLTITQKYIIACIFGIVDENNKRICRESLIMVASGFGKTTFLGAIITLLLSVDIFPRTEVFIGSNAYQQSKLCFNAVNAMIKKTPFVNDFNFRPSSGEIVSKDENRKIKAMSSDGTNQEGIEPTILLLDEVHGFKNGQYANDLKKSTKVEDDIAIDVTTQGGVRGGYLDDKLELARKQLAGVVDDESTFYFIYENESIDEVLEAYKNNDLDIICKSNPNAGQSQSANELFRKIKLMIDDPSKRFSTLTKNFNIPQNKESSYFSYDECQANEFNEKIMFGKPVFVGLDVAYTRHYKNDLTAVTFEYYNPLTNKSYHLDYFLLPRWYEDRNQKRFDMVVDKTAFDKIDYQYHIDRGDVILIEDVSITEEAIIKFITDKMTELQLVIVKFGVDPNKASKVIEHFNSLANDTKFCLPFLAERKIWTTPIIESVKENRKLGNVYTNNKLTAIHFANAMAKKDDNGYILLVNDPVKRKDMTIAHLASRSACSVWGQQKHNNILNIDRLKKTCGGFNDEI